MNIDKEKVDELIDLGFDFQGIILAFDIDEETFIETLNGFIISFNFYNIFENYLMKNRNISLEGLIKIRTEWRNNNSNSWSIDRLLIFNNNMTREKYNKIVFGCDDEHFFNLQKINATMNVNDLLEKFSFNENLLSKLINTNPVYSTSVFTYQKLSEEFVINNFNIFERNEFAGLESYIFNNKPSINFLKEFLFKKIKCTGFLLNTIKDNYKYFDAEYFNSIVDIINEYKSAKIIDTF